MTEARSSQIWQIVFLSVVVSCVGVARCAEYDGGGGTTGDLYLAGATEYYVAPDGNDNDPGTLLRPFKTIQRAADLMGPGDTCFIRNGTYRETVRPLRSGIAEAPIRFVAYPGEYPVVSGADVLDVTWTVHSGEIYKAETTKEFIQLFVDGQMMNEARWPNTAVDDLVRMKRAICDWGTDGKTLVDDALPVGDWNDAYVHITPGGPWNSITKRIKNYEAGARLDFADTQWATFDDTPRAGNRYWLFGALAGLDTATEWFLDSPGVVYVWCSGDANPMAHTVEVKQRDYAFDLSDLAHIHLEGLQVFAAGVRMADSAYCVVDDCRLRYSQHLRFHWGEETVKNINFMSGHHNEWRNSGIAHSAGNGILDAGMYNKVANCIIHDVGYLAHPVAAIESQAYRSKYIHNTLYDCGSVVIGLLAALGVHVEHNDIFNGSLITLHQQNIGVAITYDTVIAYNHIHDNYGGGGWGHGIYGELSGLLVHHNLIWSIAGDAIRMESPSPNNEFYNNTILSSCRNAFRPTTMYARVPDQRGTKVINNLANALMEFVMGDGAPEHHHNGDYPVSESGWPTRSSGAIDAGVVIPGITDGYIGAAPDIGCFEVGTEGWQAGADWIDALAE